nr:M90 family metallopeptidase [Coralloluteibacterium stylophorae]
MFSGLARRVGIAAPTPQLGDAEWRHVCADVALVGRLDAERQARLRALAARFLATKTVTAAGALTLDARQRHVLAALCCLPVLEFGFDGLRGWSQLIVYPDAFRVNRSHHDDATGVLTEWEDELAGEAWSDGPLILSWRDVEGDLDDPEGGCCVAVHEVAHKLDLLDGVLDGTPLLPRDWQRAWARDFQQAYDAFCADVDAGDDRGIDAYAAEGPDEFFAVTSEYHFSAPALLRGAMPAVADHLHRFYGRSPFA